MTAERQPHAASQPSDPTFGFPFKPYSIQQDLLEHLYSSLARGQITVIESPTGTGKSLSLICSTLSFLRDSKQLARANLINSTRRDVTESNKDEPDWVLQHEIATKVRELERDERAIEERLELVRTRERAEAARGTAAARRRKKMRMDNDGGDTGRLQVESEDQYAPEPYFDDEADAHKVSEDGVDNFTPAVREMMKKMYAPTKEREEEEPDVKKVYFASRTHSQLSQFVTELRKTCFASGPDPSLSSHARASDSTNRPVRIIPLGSRQNLCINDDVRRKSGGSNEVMGDMCLELQKASGKDKDSKRCQFLPPADEPGKLNDFRDRALANVHDIEDIEDLGRKSKVCPYYGSRKAVRSAEVVTLPYNMLMSRSAREALGISVKDHVVVIDEAHNLIDSILQLHSVTITSSMLMSTRGALLTYITKFKSRFTGANAAYLKQLALILKGLCEFIGQWAGSMTGDKGKKEEMLSVNKLLHGAGGAVDQINLLKLDTYLRTSRIARKIGGYVDSLAEEKTASGRQAIRSTATRHLQRIQEFILSLANPDRDGRILLTAERVPLSTSGNGASSTTVRTDVSLKYMLLAPSESFREVAEEAGALILAGGTMAPMSDFKEQLFPSVDPKRFSTFSCGHVVPPDHIATFAVSRGPSGVEFQFKYDRRKDEKLIDDLGQAIVNIAQIVPNGVVVFVPSYDFLNQVQARWEKAGLLKRLVQKKKTFWEPKATADVDQTLREYSLANSGSSSGGILFAVVGAKLSEGINFADDMARAVIICGIPYPNAQSTELKERMAYLKATSTGSQHQQSATDAGQVLYNNLAFRAVNQSIGRAIRNINDWAAIILLDARYQQPNKKAQLPAWLGQDIQSPSTFGALIKSLAAFMKRRKEATAVQA